MIIDNAAITVLAGEEGVKIELHDKDAGITFAKVVLTTEQFCQALSRLAHTPCKAEVFGPDKIGKEQEHKRFEFMLPEGSGFRDKKAAVEAVKACCPEGWTADTYFGNQASFFARKNDQGKEERWARTTIRRWVNKDNKGEVTNV